MDFFDILLAKKLEDDRDPTIEGLSVTENGIYSEENKAYNPVIVEVPEPTLITKSITANGTYSASDDNADGYSSVTVAVEGFKKKSIANTPTDIASFNDGTANPMPSLEISIEPVQSGSGDPSPSNVRPISGWSGANVTRCGKNLFDKSKVLANTRVKASGTEPNPDVSCSDFIKIKANTSYYLSKCVSINIMNSAYLYDKNKNFIRYLGDNNDSFSILTNSDEAYLRINIANANVDLCQLIEGNEAPTSYHAYNGSTTSIPFHDSSDNPITVYGGTLNVTSGELRVTMASVDMGTLEWVKWTKSTRWVFYAIIPEKENNRVNTVLCEILNHLETSSTGMDNADGLLTEDNTIVASMNTSFPTVVARCNTYSDAQAFTTAISGKKLVYELATPITYQLTPTQVSTLLGQNNIFADCGQILDGEYFVTL